MSTDRTAKTVRELIAGTPGTLSGWANESVKQIEFVFPDRYPNDPTRRRVMGEGATWDDAAAEFKRKWAALRESPTRPPEMR